METDEWLQILAQHSVFSEPKSSSSRKERAGGPGAVSVNSASTRRERVAIRGTDLFVAIGKEVRWINLKACKDTFVRCESKRVGVRGFSDANDLESKQDAVSSVPWYRLGCEVLFFDINKLAINQSGKLLVAMGDHQVAVIVLPPPGAATKKPARGAFGAARFEDLDGEETKEQGVWYDCRSMMVGSSAAGGKGKNTGRRRSSGVGAGMSATENWSVRMRVVDVLWHPVSASDSHLLVLHATGTIKMYDVSEDLDSPEQIVSLFGAKEAGGSAFAMSHAISFCLGSNTSAGWSRVTVFVLTNTGELYSLCPMLPRRCCVERGWLEGLLESAELDVREWQAEEYETSEHVYTPPELADARTAVKWLDKILDLDKGKAAPVLPASLGSPSAISGDDCIYLILPPSLVQTPIPQGPYLFQPEPNPVDGSEFDSEDSSSGYDSDEENGNCAGGCDPDDASDVLYLQPGSNDYGAGVGLIAISYCDARVEVFADLQPVICRWATPLSRGVSSQRLPALATLASIDLAVAPLTSEGDGAQNECSNRHSQKRAGATVTLQKDALSPAMFYALHQHGVHRVDVRKWAVLLDKAIGLGSDENRRAALESLLYVLDGRGNMTSVRGASAVNKGSGNDEGERGALARRCVQCVVHTHPRASQPAIPVMGAAVVDDIYLSYSLLALVAPCQLVGIALPLPSNTEDSNDDDLGELEEEDTGEGDSERRRIDLSVGTKDVVYVPRLSKNGYKLPAALNGNGAAVQQPRFVLREDNPISEGDEVSEEKLKLLGSVVGQLHSQLKIVADAHSSMREHMDLQVQEHKRQHDKLAAISSGFQKHFEQLRLSQRRIDALQGSTRKLSLRVDQALRQLLSFYQPELTANERAFGQEVREMEMYVNGADGYRQAVNALHERVNDMHTLTRSAARARDAAAASRTMGASRLSSAALEKIRMTLDSEQSNLKDTCKRIEELQARVEDVCEGQAQA
ncbi:hypothetical protein IW140_000685 [Coemansia sp. RSA 1813]|nr:hypothetical protein EV178_000810 [Coemansia sp. RSA 1646]KAJ1773864.1 hypothetical protein LPJ74_000408 [Coemansia sp. RSA 1843]KAJ2092430.1 hypothetical protein IW138_001192 [Coemansia sp. RSA 986]KAJ2217346.1 hypothetical protein EV179_000496 [Coemansia sp. RSA 487]KAJ2572570.1 hypothetical protein IW140_000685 [Coemansia sp. RSA 1813]